MLDAPGALAEVLRTIDARSLDFHLHDWLVLARDDQLPPADEAWATWLVLGGRGAGKTRSGAEWIRAQALGLAPLAAGPAARIAIVGETMHDARSVMVEGVSGLLAVHRAVERPTFEPSRNRLVWPNGAVGELFSADDPDSLRGPQFAVAWTDEIAKWRYAEEAWDMLQLGLRLGPRPRTVATTTPRPHPLVRRLIAEPLVRVTRTRTRDNAINLAPTFVAEMTRRFAGSALGRQELEGELVDDATAALWRRAWLEEHRLAAAPELQRIVVGVDPPVTASGRSDGCGIIVAGLGRDGRGYVLQDRSLDQAGPDVWARAAVAAWRDWSADAIVAEVNQGGDLVTGVLRQVHANVPVRTVRATRGKWIRAEPVAALYAEGRVAHAGRFDRLEDEMCAFGAGRSGGKSPDRMDALVWALTDLMIEPAVHPAVRRL